MNNILKSVLLSAELCPADEAVDFVMLLQKDSQIESWKIILEREDVQKSLRRETGLLSSLLNCKKVHLPSEFFEFCFTVEEVQDNLFLKAKRLALKGK